jgi:hypothetical protein
MAPSTPPPPKQAGLAALTMAALEVEGAKSTTDPRIMERVVEGERENVAMRVQADDILVSKRRVKKRKDREEWKLWNSTVMSYRQGNPIIKMRNEGVITYMAARQSAKARVMNKSSVTIKALGLRMTVRVNLILSSHGRCRLNGAVHIAHHLKLSWLFHSSHIHHVGF